MAVGKFKKKSDGKGTQILAGAALGLVALGIMGFFIWKGFNKGPTLDKVTFCPDQIRTVTAVLVDTSDELSPVQRADIANRIDQIKDGLPRQGRIDLYAMGIEKDGLPRALFSMCNPGSGNDADALTENARLMKRKFTRDFSDKLDNELKTVMRGKDASSSPIMETVKAVAVQSFGASATREADEKTLVIVSDMIQHTPAYSQFKGVSNDEFERFAKTQYFQQVRTEMRRVEVELLYIRRPTQKNVQSNQHVLFWERFFRDAGAKVAHVAPM